MKKKAYLISLCAIAVLCAAAVMLAQDGSFAAMGLFSFPFRQLGGLLRSLSLSGAGGNLCAIAVYVLIGIIPLIPALTRLARSKAGWADLLLAVLSVLLFVGMYFMINPGLISDWMENIPSTQVGMALIGCTIYAVLLGYIVLRMLSGLKAAEDKALYKALDILLAVSGMVMAAAVFGGCLSDMRASLAALKAGNTMPGQELGLTQFFIVLRTLTDALPYVLDVLVIIAARGVTANLSLDRYSQDTADAAAGLSELCARALGITVITNTVFNLLQLIFAGRLLVIDSFAQLPLVSIAFVLAAMLLSRLIAEGKQLKDDNDAFI